jgi:hypothetical protein
MIIWRSQRVAGTVISLYSLIAGSSAVAVSSAAAMHSITYIAVGDGPAYSVRHYL